MNKTALGMTILGVIMISTIFISLIVVAVWLYIGIFMPYLPYIIGLICFTVAINAVGVLLDKRLNRKYQNEGTSN